MKCPYCKDVEMKAASKLGKGWYQCPNCGGTEVENPTTEKGGDLIATESDPSAYGSKYKPSASVQAEAKKAREAKK